MAEVNSRFGCVKVWVVNLEDLLLGVNSVGVGMATPVGAGGGCRKKKLSRACYDDQAQKWKGTRFPSVAPSSKWGASKRLQPEVARGLVSGYLASLQQHKGNAAPRSCRRRL